MNNFKNDTSRWFDMAGSYLELADLICEEIINHKYYKFETGDSDEDISKSRIVLFYFPLIYNLKHGTELLLKAIIFHKTGIIKRMGKNGHDLNFLLNKLKDQGEIENRAFLEKMICNYYNLDFLKVTDKDNAASRFPDCDEIDYFSVIYNVDNERSENIHKIKEDITELKHFLFNYRKTKDEK